MRIAFTGASGTGKTTLAKFLAAELGLEFNPVGSRSTAEEMGFDNPYAVDRASLKVYEKALMHVDVETAADLAKAAWQPGVQSVRPKFQLKLQLKKLEWEWDHDNFVTDRTPICDLAYLCLHAHEWVEDKFIERALEHTRTYTHIFWTPLINGQWHGGDPARLDGGPYHDIHECLIKGWLERTSVQIIEVDQADLQERKRDVLREVAGTAAANKWWKQRPKQVVIAHRWGESGRYWDCPYCEENKEPGKPGGSSYSTKGFTEPGHEMNCPTCGIVYKAADNYRVGDWNEKSVNDYTFLYEIQRPELKLTLS